MSIINEALKKAGQEKGIGLGFEMERKKSRMNWGPLFVLLVLFLITGPLIAPIFSSPFRRSFTADETAMVTQSAGLPPPAGSINRKSQFSVEEASVFQGPAQSPVIQTPYLKLSGIMYSPKDSYCIINNKIIKIGEEVQGARLTTVTPREVILEYQGENVSLSVSQ